MNCASGTQFVSSLTYRLLSIPVTCHNSKFFTSHDIFPFTLIILPLKLKALDSLLCPIAPQW